MKGIKKPMKRKMRKCVCHVERLVREATARYELELAETACTKGLPV
jgi:hypothetical protein